MDLRLLVPIRAALVEVDGVVNGTGGAVEALDACAEQYRADFAVQGITAPGSVPGVDVGRRLFHALGLDPTRHRPCSEALLNRALKGKPQPHISDLVDVGNWCALDFLLPLGVYDAGAIEGEIVLRLGAAGETYAAINGRDITLEGRYVLADSVGPFGSPITDSQRTAVSAQTTHAVVVLYAPMAFDEPALARDAERLASRLVERCGGTAVRVEMREGSPGAASSREGAAHD